jgi:hypothetical protein
MTTCMLVPQTERFPPNIDLICQVSRGTIYPPPIQSYPLIWGKNHKKDWSTKTKGIVLIPLNQQATDL